MKSFVGVEIEALFVYSGLILGTKLIDHNI